MKLVFTSKHGYCLGFAVIFKPVCSIKMFRCLYI